MWEGVYDVAMHRKAVMTQTSGPHQERRLKRPCYLRTWGRSLLQMGERRFVTCVWCCWRLKWTKQRGCEKECEARTGCLHQCSRHPQSANLTYYRSVTWDRWSLFHYTTADFIFSWNKMLQMIHQLSASQLLDTMQLFHISYFPLLAEKTPRLLKMCTILCLISSDFKRH